MAEPLGTGLLVPNFIFNKLVYTEGEQKGHVTEEWEVYFAQLQTQLQTNFSAEGLVVPCQPSADPNNFAIIQPGALVGTLLFDQTNDELNVKLEDGLFHPLQIGGLAVLVIDGTAGDISATRVGQTVTIDLVNTAVTPGTYAYPSSLIVDDKGRITSIANGNPVLSVTGTVNQINVSPTTVNPVVSISDNPILPGTAGFVPPIGTTAQRPGSPLHGEIRYNTDLTYLETYTAANTWQPIDTAGGTVTSLTAATGIVLSPTTITTTGSIGWNNTGIYTPTAISYSALSTDCIIGVTSTAAPITITLPTAASGNTGKLYIVKDESGGAATNNITINVTGGGNIDGASSQLIATNYGALNFYSNGSQWFIW